MKKRHWLLRPRQVIVTDRHSTGSARILYVRPLSFTLLLLGAGAGLYLAGLVTPPPHDGSSDRSAQIARMQHDLNAMKDDIAEKEAMLVLRDRQIESLTAEISDLQQRQTIMQKRLDMFDSILDARKNQGVHILQPMAHRLGKQAIAYSFVLVKGGNYPRTASGRILFSAVSPDGEEISIPLADGKDALPYRTQSHTFVQGQLPWEMPWQPKTLRITLQDRRGRVIAASDTDIRD